MIFAGKMRLFMKVVVLSIACAASAVAGETITIGLNLPLSGSLRDIGIHSRDGAELLRERINNEGGVLVNGERHPVEFIYADNKSSVESAVSGALKLISQDKVLAIVGPCASSNAIPVGNISESFKVPMISPTSTNPKTTRQRPFVFRACFLDAFQGEAMARFASNELKASRAAILFDSDNAYPRGLAEFFHSAFEAIHGPGSVVAFESYETDDSNLSASLQKIVKADADVLFLPQYAHELPGILKQVREAGFRNPVLGGDAWEASDLMDNCGDLCKGLYFSSHFTAVGTEGSARDFVDQYLSRTGQSPTAFGALGYDAVGLLLEAISQIDGLSGDLFQDRAAIKKRIAKITDFTGVSGTINMNAGGDPEKSAVVIRITEQGEFESFATATP